MATGTAWPNLGLNNWNGTDYVKRAEIDENFQKIDNEFHATTGHGHTGAAGDGPKITSSGLASSAATDVVIGNRTITDTTAQTAGAAATLTVLLGQIGNALKAITGKANWYTAPTASLESIYTALSNQTGTPKLRASVGETKLTTTAATTVASYTPTTQANFTASVYLRVTSAATVTVAVTYNDATGAQTNPVITTLALNVGSYSLVPSYFNAVSGTPVSVQVTANVANAVYASASIKEE